MYVEMYVEACGPVAGVCVTQRETHGSADRTWRARRTARRAVVLARPPGRCRPSRIHRGFSRWLSSRRPWRRCSRRPSSACDWGQVLFCDILGHV
jgi:hypothetical protein